LGDVVGSSGDIQSLVMARICAGWLKFSELSLKYYVGEFYH